MTGIDFNYFKETIICTPAIINEIKNEKYKEKNRNILQRIELAIELGKLIIKNPAEYYIKLVEEKSKFTGDINALSKQDIELIALALELMNTTNNEIILYTNDYSIENLCSELNLKFKTLFKNGIKNKIYFEVYCPYCKKIYKSEDLNKICERCGLKLKRRFLKKEKI
ncbi:MAG: ribonuclease VapC [Candidatus Lokiarchaeota archaeon]|nr:ribonuclease VapC [Candidatus Lokiarchaeota archaeon]